MHKKSTSLFHSVSYALQGLVFVLKTQRNARLHLLAAILTVLLGILLKINALDWRWLIFSISLVWFAEMINTAFEHLCDVVMPELHISVQRAKDIAAGAVLICAIAAIFIGALIFWPYIVKQIF